jgi:hypothetical protein
MSIDEFNKQLQSHGHSYQMSENVDYYSMRIAKTKNGKPNSDYPSK